MLRPAGRRAYLPCIFLVCMHLIRGLGLLDKIWAPATKVSLKLLCERGSWPKFLTLWADAPPTGTWVGGAAICPRLPQQLGQVLLRPACPG